MDITIFHVIQGLKLNSKAGAQRSASTVIAVGGREMAHRSFNLLSDQVVLHNTGSSMYQLLRLTTGRFGKVRKARESIVPSSSMCWTHWSLLGRGSFGSRVGNERESPALEIVDRSPVRVCDVSTYACLDVWHTFQPSAAVVVPAVNCCGILNFDCAVL